MQRCEEPGFTQAIDKRKPMFLTSYHAQGGLSTTLTEALEVDYPGVGDQP